MNEIWKEIPGFEGHYEASNLGRVRSLERKIKQGNRWGQVVERIQKSRILKPKNSQDGYHEILLYLSGNRHYVRLHRIIAITFLPNPNNKSQVDHKDSNKKNNNLSNLRWVTSKQNSEAASESGLLK